MNNYKTEIKKAIKNIFEHKVPVSYPVMNGGGLLDDRCALITGGASGIGYAIAEQFVRNRASVIIVGRDEERLKDATKALSKLTIDNNQKIYYFMVDISEPRTINDGLSRIIDNVKEKKIDILVNNAGISSGANFGATAIEDFESVFRTNVEGTYFITQEVCNYMRRNKIKGNILNVLSSSSKRPAASPYMMSKWALSGLTLGMAKVCIKDGIVVNAVAPGPTATKMLMQEPGKDISNSGSPIGRYIMPEEIANIAVMLVSDIGRCIVGDTVYATGGSGIITYDDIGY